LRIGIDCQALQTAHSAQRGIGIYTRSLLSSLLTRGEDDYHLFFNARLESPHAGQPAALCHPVDYVEKTGSWEPDEANEYLQRLAYESCGLDLLHVASVQEGPEAVIDSSAGRRSFPIVCTLFDLIPLLYPGVYLADPAKNARYLRRLELYRRAEIVLTISDNSRNDALRLLGLSEDRVVNVGAAIDPSFRPLDLAAGSTLIQAVKQALGIQSPFVLCTGGFDFRKNLNGMLESFSRLPDGLKHEFQLVIVGALPAEGILALHDLAQRYGIADRLVLTKRIPRDSLVALYNACEVFVFPSLYEGFGLPVLEAMSCGAPVVASNTPATAETLGDAGIQVDPADSRAIAQAMQSVMESQTLREELKAKALSRSQMYSWEATAQATKEVFHLARDRWKRSGHLVRGRKPKIAFFSPLPPRKSGISHYSAQLLPHLSKHFDIDVYVDGYLPSQPPVDGSLRFFPTSPELSRERYFSRLFQLGNSAFHAYMYEYLLRHGGITALHEVSLHGLVHATLVDERQSEQRYAEEIVYEHGEEGRAALEMHQQGEVDGATMMALFPLNERALSASKAVIVHSEFARRQLLKGRSEQIVPRVKRINQGVTVLPLPAPSQTQTVRARLGIPGGAFVVGVFGMMTESKQLEVGLRAFQRLRQHDGRAWYLSVGEFAFAGYEASILRLCEQLGIGDRVVFAGYAGSQDFSDYVFTCDVALSLRYPNMGETSAAMLQALACGIPTIVNDLAAFAELPSDAVVKVQIGQDQEDDIADALRLLAEDQALCRRLGTAARRYILEHHSWETVAAQYADYICYVESTGLGDQTDLRAVLGRVVDKARTLKGRETRVLDRTIDAFAGSAGLGRVLWI